MVEFAKSIPDELKILQNDELKLELSIGLIDSKQFYYLMYDKGNNKIGQCGIRLENNSKNEYLGNIEYEVFKEYRGNNYAEKACKLLSNIALYFNISNIIITANPDNLPSNRTIQKLGARFIEIRKVPKNMALYKTSKEVNIYEWNLERKTL